MTHPLTPREKVARAALWAEMNHSPGVWDTEPEEWSVEALETHGYFAIADAILTALASGSGDHAELEYYGYRAFNAGIGCCHLVANPGPNDTNPEPLVTAASAKALLAENAALRAKIRTEIKLSVDNYVRATARATEAERKLAEADRLLERIANDPTWDGPSSARLYFLSKEAERG